MVYVKTNVKKICVAKQKEGNIEISGTLRHSAVKELLYPTQEDNRAIGIFHFVQ